MENMTYNKVDLLEILGKNRAHHKVEFQEAVEGYRRECTKLLNAYVRDLKRGKTVYISINLPIPTDQTKDYDRVIRMLSLTVVDTIELNERDFNCYVMDEWAWSDVFAASTMNYKVK